MARLNDLKLKCVELGLLEGIDFLPTRKRLNKEGESYENFQLIPNDNTRHLEFSTDDYVQAIQKYYLQKYEREGTKSPFIDTILNMKSPMLALQIKHMKPEEQQNVKTDFSNYIYTEKIDRY